MKVLVIQLRENVAIHPDALLNMAANYRKSINEHGVLILPNDVTYDIIELDGLVSGIVCVPAETGKRGKK